MFMPTSLQYGAGTNPLQAFNSLMPNDTPMSIADGTGSMPLTADMSGFSASMPILPKIGGGGGLFGGMTGLEKVNLGLNGLSTLGGLFLGLKQLGLANKQFNLQRSVANANLANQIQAYNTTLADRSRSRAVVEGQTPDQAKAYVDQNKLASRPL